jgi:YfiH family protein
METVEPDWPVTAVVRAISTTRRGGASEGDWASFNLGVNGGDRPEAVAANRDRLNALLPAEPRWLEQVHGTDAIHLDDWSPGLRADAAWTDRPGQVVIIQTADCLPILLADPNGALVAGVHGGWRSLAGGIIDRTLSVLPVEASGLCAWIGPAICGDCYQVGGEVREAFLALDPTLDAAFVPDGNRWRADLKCASRHLLERRGVSVADCGQCTYEQPERFFSFRRDGRTGRMATLIWLEG